MDVQQLQEEKTAIKRELKSFDHEFQKKHGYLVSNCIFHNQLPLITLFTITQPSKLDKEPLRVLYSRYRDVKIRMEELEEQEREDEQVLLSRREGQSLPSLVSFSLL